MSSSPAFAPDHHHLSPSEQICYVHCVCNTVLAVSLILFVGITALSVTAAGIWFLLGEVSVPCTSLFKTVTVRCGHCTNLLSVNMRGLPAANQLHLEEFRSSPSNSLINQPNPNELMMPVRGIDELPKPPAADRRER